MDANPAYSSRYTRKCQRRDIGGRRSVARAAYPPEIYSRNCEFASAARFRGYMHRGRITVARIAARRPDFYSIMALSLWPAAHPRRAISI